MYPESEDDWLIVAGDVADGQAGIEWALRLLAERFGEVVWVPGNHELLHPPRRPAAAARRAPLLAPGRALPQARRHHSRGPLPGLGRARRPGRCWRPSSCSTTTRFGRNVAPTKAEALRRAHEAGVVCVDEFLLHPDPLPEPRGLVRGAGRRDRTAGCAATSTRHLPTVLVNHFPLIADADPGASPSRVRPVVRHRARPRTGTAASDATAVVYGHLHIPRTTLARRGALRGGLARLPARAGAPARPGVARPRADPAGGRRRARADPARAPWPSPSRGDEREVELLPGGGGGGRPTRSRSAAASSSPRAPAPARRWRSWARQPAAGARPAPRRAGLAGRDRRQHHPLRRLPRLRGGAGRPTLVTIGIDAELDEPLPGGADRRHRAARGAALARALERRGARASTGTACSSAPRSRSTRPGSRWPDAGSASRTPASRSTPPGEPSRHTCWSRGRP